MDHIRAKLPPHRPETLLQAWVGQDPSQKPRSGRCRCDGERRTKRDDCQSPSVFTQERVGRHKPGKLVTGQDRYPDMRLQRARQRERLVFRT